MTGARHIVIPESSESHRHRSDLRELQFQGTSVVLLGLCAVAMVVDLLPFLLYLSGLYDNGTFYFSWLLVVSVPANVGALVLFPIGAYLARRATRGPKTTGLTFYLMSSAVGTFTLKILIFWGVGVVMGIDRARWLFIVAVAVSGCAIWALRRAKASGTTLRPAYCLLALLSGILLTEFAVSEIRNF